MSRLKYLQNQCLVKTSYYKIKSSLALSWSKDIYDLKVDSKVYVLGIPQYSKDFTNNIIKVKNHSEFI